MGKADSPPIPVSGIKGWMVRVRAPFFTATLIPIILGTVVAWVRTGHLLWGYFLLTLVGGAALHAGTNMINDYFDHLSGDDRVNKEFVAPFTGGSRLIQLGLVSPERMRNEGLFYLAFGSVIGIFLAWARTPWILALGIIGVFSSYLYVAPMASLAGMGLGELFVGLDFGVLMTLGAWAVQTRALAWEPVWASLPVAFLITAVLFINEFPDATADAQVGKRHWVVRLGRKKASPWYGALLFLAYLSLVAGVAFGGMTPWSLLGLVTIPIAWKAWNIARVHYDDIPNLAPANAATVQIHMLTGALITLGYIIDGILLLL